MKKHILKLVNGKNGIINEKVYYSYGKYIKFTDYEDYRNFILKTRKEKDNRVYKKRG